MNKAEKIPNVISAFASTLGVELKNHRLEIPEKFGRGYCSGFDFNENIRLLIFNYELYEDLILKNPDSETPGRMLFFKFQNIFPKSDALPSLEPMRLIPSVLIATTQTDTSEIPVHTHTATVIIQVSTDYLRGLFDISKQSVVLQNLLHNSQTLLFEQLIFPSLLTIVDEMIFAPANETFQLFFLRIKAEELICRLLMELEKRSEKQVYNLTNQDIQTIFKVKTQMLEHLEKPPVINELALIANMSPTKLKRLFRQIFGNSIFNYYQEFRMKEAAFLLTNKKLTVSEVGYRLGFSNLSHFTKVFNAQMGMNPKQYSQSSSMFQS